MTSFHDTTPDRCPSLIDEEAAFRKLIARLFRGNVREVVSELLQNSQRAGATQIDFEFPDPTRCSIRDDGHGLTQGLGSLYRLLRLVDTFYENEDVEVNQSPMGMGFYSLLALPGIHRVSIESHTVELEIETERWFNDRDYRETWPVRVRRPATRSERGLRLAIEGEERTLTDLRTALISGETREWEYWVHGEPLSAARGYAGILNILLDGSPVDTTLPSWFTLPHADFVDSYQGNEIRVQLCEEAVGYHGLRVLWYGQPIGCSRSACWNAFLDVRQGTPLHPQAPTRQRIREDEALQNLVTWIEDRIFRFVGTSPLPDTRHVKALYRINWERAERECPFAIIQPWCDVDGNASLTSYQSLKEEMLGEEIVVGRAEVEQMLVLDEEVVALLPESHPAGQWTWPHPDPVDGALHVPFDYGIQSLLAATGVSAYRSVVGAEPTGTLWWKPGGFVDPLLAMDLGEWGIGTLETPPECWSPVPQSFLPVYLHADLASWDIEDAHFIIGAPSKERLIEFLRERGRVAWEPDEDREEESEAVYDESVAALIRRHLGDTIAASSVAALLYEVEPFVGGRGCVKCIELLYETEQVGAPNARPKRIRLHTQDGSSKELSLD